MSIAVIALIVLIGMALGGAYLHKSNMENAYQKVMDCMPKSSNYDKNNEINMKKALMTMMFAHQGPNFNALVITGWLLFFIAAFFSFLLTPQIFGGLTYLRIPELAQFSIGPMLFALIPLIIGIIFVVGLRVPQVYGYYVIPIQLKKAMMATLLLPFATINISVYLATVFPYPNSISFLIDVAFILLILTLFMLLSPIFFEAKGAKP